MKKNKICTLILLLALAFLLTQCINDNNEPKEIEYSKKVLIDKTIEVKSGRAIDRGYSRYLLAFNDGYTKSTSFGYYSCLKIGDTVTFEKEVGRIFWKMKPNCN